MTLGSHVILPHPKGSGFQVQGGEQIPEGQGHLEDLAH